MASRIAASVVCHALCPSTSRSPQQAQQQEQQCSAVTDLVLPTQRDPGLSVDETRFVFATYAALAVQLTRDQHRLAAVRDAISAARYAISVMVDDSFTGCPLCA